MGRIQTSLCSLVALAALWGPAALAQEQSTELDTLLASAAHAQTAEALRAHSRQLDALVVSYEVALPRVLATNENLYVFVIQQQLLARELRSARPTGILSRSSMRELLELCIAQSVGEQCSRGPMTPEVAMLLGAVFDAGSDSIAAPAPAQRLATPASERLDGARTAEATAERIIDFPALLGGAPDFDGDGATDALLFNGTWLAYRAASGTVVNIGAASGAEPAGAGDFDGDGLDDLLLLSPAGWLSFWSQGSFVDIGAIGDGQLLAVGDVDGDGLDDALLGRGDSGWLYHVNANIAEGLGSFAGAKVVGLSDQDGDGRDDLLLQMPSGWKGVRLSATGETLPLGA